MQKVQAELDEKVGPHRLPEIRDMKDLTYTRAAICEVMRRSSVVPMGTTHATDREVKFEGYTLPKNTHVIPLLHAVHMDPKNFAEPEEFRPSRFLSPDGKKLVKPEQFMPFGAGQRMCLGDQLAEKEFFLLFASLLHSFDLSLPEGKPKHRMNCSKCRLFIFNCLVLMRVVDYRNLWKFHEINSTKLALRIRDVKLISWNILRIVTNAGRRHGTKLWNISLN